MLASALFVLLVFYAGALCASGRSWFGVWRGAVRYAALRDVTGIGDAAALRRLFGLMRPDGLYEVTIAEVLRHRRAAGAILTDLPVHALFFAALLWAAWRPESSAATGVVVAAAAHALVLGGAALSVLAGSRRAYIG